MSSGQPGRGQRGGGRPESGRPGPGQPPQGYPPAGQGQQGYVPQGYGGPQGYGQTLLGPQQPPPQPPQPGRGGRPGRVDGPSQRDGRPKRRLIDYPRAGRTGVLRWIPSWKLTGTLSLTFVVTVIVGLMAAYVAIPVPQPRPVTEAQTTTVYYSDGSPMTRFSTQEGNRTIVDISKIPEHVQNAVIAAEDKTFYTNRGVSPIGIARALWNNVRGRSTQGGSTITQQYVKNSRVTNERTFQRKVKEFIIAIKINNQAPSKKKILADYLNTIYFGRNAYGIQVAAQSYFKKDVGKLSLAEGVYLATIIQRPEYFSNIDPKKPEQVASLRSRFDYVLDTMVEIEKLTPEQRATVKIPKIEPVTQRKRAANDQTGYLEDMVREELARNGMKMSEVARAGFKIYTTFDRKLIAAAVSAVEDKDIGMGKRSTWPKGTQVGLVSIEPGTGKVRAIYGGDGVRSYSAATRDAPPAGSTYKPFTLLAALEGESKNGTDGISLKSRFNGKSPYRYQAGSVSSGSNKVTNFSNEQFGKIDLIKATEHSVNTVYAQLNEKIGDGTGKRTRQAAIDAGIPEDAIGNEVSNTLGNGTPHVVDMASAYGTMAAGGVHHPYYVIEKIVSPAGGLVYEHKDKSTKAFSKDVVADATYALQQVVEQGTGEYAKRLHRPVAGKTGTVGTTSRETKAAWFVGFTPQLSTAVAIHRLGEDGSSPEVVKGWGPFKGKDMQGGMFPVRVWTEFMEKALDGVEAEEFPEPAWVGEGYDEAPPEPVETSSPSPTDGQNGDGQNGQNGGGQNGQNGDGQGGQNGDGQGGQNGDGQGGQNGDGQGGQNGDGQNGQNGDGQNGQNGGGQGGQNGDGQRQPSATP